MFSTYIGKFLLGFLYWLGITYPLGDILLRCFQSTEPAMIKVGVVWFFNYNILFPSLVYLWTPKYLQYPVEIYISSLPLPTLCISRYNILTNLEHSKLFNSAPNGSGFLDINDQCGRSLLGIVQGLWHSSTHNLYFPPPMKSSCNS